MWSLYDMKVGNAEMLRSKVTAIANGMSFSVGKAVAESDLARLDDITEFQGSSGDILQVRIFDLNGALLHEKAFASEEDSASMNPLYIPWQDVYSVPAVNEETQVGQIEVRYSGRQMNEIMKGQLTKGPFVEGLVFILIAIGVFVFINRSVGEPLGIMMNRIEKVTEGDLTVTIPKFADNEVGFIADGVRYLMRL